MAARSSTRSHQDEAAGAGKRLARATWADIVMGTLGKTPRIRTWALVLLVVVAVIASALALRFCASAGGPPSTTQLPPSDEVVQMRGERGETPPPSEPVDATRAIYGQVVQPSGAPAVGVTVIVQAPGNEQPWEMVTDVGGTFRFDDLPLNLYAVEASKEGFGPAFVIGVVPGGASLRLVLQTGKELTGQLLRRGDVIPNGVVHVGGPGLFPQRSQAADSSGRFRVAGLRPGTYEAIAVAPGYSSGFIDNINLDSDTPAVLDLEMTIAPTMDLRIRDRRGSAPIEAGVVTIAPRSYHVLALHALIVDGQARVDFLPPGEYWIRVRAPGFMQYEGRFWVTAGGGEVDINLSRGASVAGVVVDEANNPIRGANLRAVVETPTGGRYDLSTSVFEVFHRLARPHGTPFWWPTSDYVSDANGRFSISGIPAGEAVVVARREGFSTGMSPPLVVQHDQSYEDLRIVMERGRRLRGRVENASGAPIAGAAVSATPAMLPAWVGGKSIVTDRSGSFIFEELPSAARISVRHPDYDLTSVRVELGEAGLDDFIVKLDAPNRREYSGRVLKVQGGAARGARVWVMSGASEIPVCTAVTNAEGHFRATRCSAQPERIIIYAEGFAPLLAEISDSQRAQDWTLRAGGELEIVTQRQLATVSVTPDFYLPREAWKSAPQELDRWSRGTLNNLAPGAYRVVCESEGFAPAALRVTVASGQRTEAVCPHPHRVAVQDIIVVDSQGAPVANAVVWIEGLGAARRAVSNSEGRLRLEGDPGRWVQIEAVHESWGQGNGALQLPREESEPVRIRLEHPVGGRDRASLLALLNDWGVATVTDNRSVLVDTTDPKSPAAGVGFRRGDKLLWARLRSESRLSVGIRRHNDVVVLELVRGDL